MPGSAYVCCLCGSNEFGYGNNPAPLDQMPNRCCDACNYTKVIPARMEMMFAENRGFSSEDSQDEAAAAIIGGIFTVTMGALLEQLAKALNEKDGPAATFFKDCIDYMAMSMVSSYEENTKNFPKEVKYAIDMTLGMTAKQFSEWEQDPAFEELTNLGSSENPDVETMSEVVLDEAKDGYDDDFSVMYSAESEYENHIQEAFYEDKLEDGTPQWTFLYRCNDCGSLCVANDTGRMDESEFCSDGGEDHDMEIIQMNEDEEDYPEWDDDTDPKGEGGLDQELLDWGNDDLWNFYHFQCDCGTWNWEREDNLQYYIDKDLEYQCDECESSIAAGELKWLLMSKSEVDFRYWEWMFVDMPDESDEACQCGEALGGQGGYEWEDTILCQPCHRQRIDPSNPDYNAESYVPLGEDHWDLYWLDSGSGPVMDEAAIPNVKIADRISKKLNKELEKAFNKVASGANPQTEAIKVWHHMEDFMFKYAGEGATDTEPQEMMVMWINDAFYDAGYKDVFFHRHDDNVFRWGAESYADFFTQMEELLESTTIAGGWTLDATTDQEDPDAVTMVVKFKPADPSTFFDIIE